ncbi:MAG: maleylpyruvate isomerase family mycothiol-dependent enzyme [Actinomycetota bacterium]
MEPGRYLDVVRSESAGLVAAAERAGPDAAVPSCPGWTVSDLLVHVGTVQRWAARLVRSRASAPDSLADIAHPGDAGALAGWVRAGSADLVDACAATPPDAEMWTFAGPGPARFWFRRQAQEVALHRVDAELATGTGAPLDPEVARDGIDEFLEVVVGSRLRAQMTGAGESVHLHCTDGEGEWLVRLTPDGPEVERVHAKGDVAARGSASDLLLAVRGRIGLSALEIFGDEAVLARFVDRSRL